MARSYRIVVAKPGLDGHDRGAKVVVRALRADGFEVMYTGLRRTPEDVADTVVRFGADAVGLSVLSGAHMVHFSRLLEALADRGAAGVVVFGGGIIPPGDADRLQAAGVAALFGPGTSLGVISGWLTAELDRRGADHQPTQQQVGDHRVAG